MLFWFLSFNINIMNNYFFMLSVRYNYIFDQSRQKLNNNNNNRTPISLVWLFDSVPNSLWYEKICMHFQIISWQDLSNTANLWNPFLRDLLSLVPVFKLACSGHNENLWAKTQKPIHIKINLLISYAPRLGIIPQLCSFTWKLSLWNKIRFFLWLMVRDKV
jgi:hypothetical protein